MTMIGLFQMNDDYPRELDKGVYVQNPPIQMNLPQPLVRDQYGNVIHRLKPCPYDKHAPRP